MRVSGAAFVGMVCALSACTQPTGATQLVLVTDTDIARLDSVVFEVTAPNGRSQDARGAVRPGDPVFVAMEKSAEAATGPYTVIVRGLSGAREVLTRRALISFVDGETLAAALHLVSSCVGVDCGEGQSCAPGGCRDERMEADELTPWTGEPPRLDERPDAEADAGRTAVDAATSDGATSDAGPLASTDAGASRDAGQTAADAGAPNACGAVEPCHVGCGGKGAACELACPSDTRCDVDCRQASRCNLACDGTCTIDCRGADACLASCAPGASCDIDCRGPGNCQKIQCRGDARCVLRCNGASSCGFETCESGAVQTCADGRMVCNARC